MSFKKKEISFSRKKVKKVFKIKTNMPNKMLISAFHNWSVRTKKFNVLSFCDYVNDKMIWCKCYPAK